MTSLIRKLVLCVGLLTLPTTVHAVGFEPTIRVQIQSIDTLMTLAEKAVDRYVAPGLGKNLISAALRSLGDEPFAGLDRTKPFGLYAIIDENQLDSKLVLMIPTQDSKKLREKLKKLDITFQDNADSNIATVNVPDVPVPFYSITADGYAYLSVLSSAPLEPKNRPWAAEVFRKKESALVSVSVNLDNLPKSYKEAATTMVETAALDIKEAKGPSWAGLVGAMIGNLGSELINQTTELTYRLNLAPETSMLELEMELTPKAGSSLAKTIQDRKPVGNHFTGVASPDSTAAVLLHAPLFNSDLRKIVGAMLKDAEPNDPKGPALIGKAALDSLKQAVESGNLDLALSLRGPDSDKHYSVVLVTSMPNADAVLAAIRKELPNRKGGPKITDTEKLDGASILEIDLDGALPPFVADLVSDTSKLKIAFAKDRLIVSLGPDSKALIQEAIAVKPSPASPVRLTFSAKRLQSLLETIAPPEVADGFSRVWPKNPDLTTMVDLNITSGSSLKVKLSLNIGLFSFGMVARSTAP
ncbi:hypothetical protein [Tuwongella immobilis]|nr:hypothetical protein [Tuwongella immobilis]